MRALFLSLAIGMLGSAAAQAPAPAPVPPGPAITVATHYFYWYQWPSEHFARPDAPGPDGHCHQFPAPEQVSYLSVDWHAENLAAMGDCGIDAALPVYWGAPGAYDLPPLAFSRRGLPPMVAALDRLAAAGTPAPRLGLMYDTTTLANAVRGVQPADGKADLTTPAGRALFCGTVVEYFAAIPDRHWARHRGGVLVVLYVSAFAAKWDRELGATLRRAFQQRFPGERVCLVADASWGDIGQDLTTRWGAALWGPSLHPGVAQIGPGYDDRVVPGRHSPVREREDGAFYAHSWQRALRHRPELVLLETWNEMHEGSELCATRETGTAYLEATRAFVARLRAGDDPGPPVPLRWPEPRPRPQLGWGEEAADAVEVAADYAAGTRRGLREIAQDDGAPEVRDGTLRPRRDGRGGGSFLYFQVSDHFVFDTAADFVLEVVHDAVAPLQVEYDSRDRRQPLGGAYTPSRPGLKRREGPWVVETFLLRGARFANRQNGGADLRLVLPWRTGAIRSVRLWRMR
ncbi:MAG: hypothetical protein KF830_06385 [Planctomycetes bacterium]|nr:hypothetical protein [Planctomycetota bacterium]